MTNDRLSNDNIREKVWEDIPTLYLGFVWAGKMEFGEVGSFGPSFLITNFARYDGLPMHPVAPPSLDYVPGPEHPPSLDYVPGPEHPPSPVEVPYVPEPEYPEYLVPSDAEEPLEDQPLPADASHTALSQGYVADSNPEEDPEEDPEEEQADYPTDEGNSDNEPSDDDDDNDEADDKDEEASKDEDDDKEEEEYLAPTDSSVVPIVNPVPSAGDTKAFKTDESAPTPRSPQTKARIAEHVVAPTPPSPPPSPLSPWSSPLPHIPSLPLPGSWDSDESCITTLITSIYFHRTDIPEAEMPPWTRACFTTPASRLEVVESSAAGAARQPGPTLEADHRRDKVGEMGYGITDTWDEIVEAMMEIASTTLEGDDRAFLRAQVKTLFKDRRFHRHTAMLLDREATYARRAWTGFEDRSETIEAHTQLTTTLGFIETLEARDPEPQDEPAEAGISC
ncbi:hypothetical protein Tco_0295190 [Tanacetum coccineum]